MKVSPARRVASQVLYRVAHQKAWASPALDAEIRRAELDARDAALATEIVYGALRVLPALDDAITALLKHRRKVDPWVWASFRAAAYQLFHLGRIPARAIVHDTVSLVRKERGAHLARFANAILRGLSRSRPSEPQPPTGLVLPGWLRQRLLADLGAQRGEAFLELRPLPPPLCLRLRGEPEATAARIAAARPKAKLRRAAHAPNALLVSGGGNPRDWPGYADGAFVVQDEGSQLIALASAGEADQSWADLCAGHGGKVLYWADLAPKEVRLLAADLHESKLEELGREALRLGHLSERVELAPLDLRVGTGGFRDFDFVLVDAPCSGLGTIHRRPEILLRTSPEKLEEMAELQLSILTKAVGLLRSGGILSYSVCSPTRIEGLGVAERLEHRFSLERLGTSPVSGVSSDADRVLRLGPWLDAADGAMDAYQLFRWRVQ